MSRRMATDADWLPSRARFATFRLVSFIKMSGKVPAAPDPDRCALLTLTAEQNPVETYAMLAIAFLELSLFSLEILSPAASPAEALRRAPLAVAGAVVLAHALLPIGSFITIAIRRLGGGRNTTTLAMMTRFHLTAMTLCAAWMGTRPSFVRWAGIGWLVLLAINGVAAAILRLLRDRVEALEQQWREWIFDAQF